MGAVITADEIREFVLNPNRPFPDISVEGGPFWDGLREGELRFQQCDACGRYRNPPRLACPFCGHSGATWRSVEPSGVIHTFTIVHRPPDSGFKPFVPYVIAVLDLVPEGLRLIGNVLGLPPEQVRIGMPVKILIDRINDQISLYHFESATS
jgi:uncharacterized protein